MIGSRSSSSLRSSVEFSVKLLIISQLRQLGSSSPSASLSRRSRWTERCLLSPSGGTFCLSVKVECSLDPMFIETFFHPNAMIVELECSVMFMKARFGFCDVLCYPWEDEVTNSTQIVEFKRCSFGCKGPKVPDTIIPPVGTIDTNGSMFLNVIYTKFWPYRPNVESRNWDLIKAGSIFFFFFLFS